MNKKFLFKSIIFVIIIFSLILFGCNETTTEEKITIDDTEKESEKQELNGSEDKEEEAEEVAENNSESSEINHKPVSNAGVNQTVTIGDTVQLDGSLSSDEDGDKLIYIWTIISKPKSSLAKLSSSTIVNPIFIPDKTGNYTIQLVVSDGKESGISEVVITSNYTWAECSGLPSIKNSLNVFWCSFLPNSTIELKSGLAYWIRMSIGFEGDNGEAEAKADKDNIRHSVTLDGNELKLIGDTKIEYNSGAGFWEINGYYCTEILDKGSYEIVGTSYRSGEYVGSASFTLVAK